MMQPPLTTTPRMNVYAARAGLRNTVEREFARTDRKIMKRVSSAGGRGDETGKLTHRLGKTSDHISERQLPLSYLNETLRRAR